MPATNYILQARQDEFEYSPSGKELGVIERVVEESPANIADDGLKKIYANSQNRPIRLYDVRLVSRPTIFYGIPALLGRNDISVFDVGDMVLIDYLASPPTRQPFIVSSVELYPKNQATSGLVPPVNAKERFIQTSLGNSIHLRNDGAVVITGGYALPTDAGSSGHYTSDNPFHLILGGYQGKSNITGNQIRITLQDKLGTVFTVDNNGILTFTRSDIHTYASTTEEHVSESMDVSIGMKGTSDSTRTGTYSLAVARTGEETFLEGLTVQVGEDGQSDLRDANYTLKVAKQADINVGNGKAMVTMNKDGSITLKNDDRSITLTSGGEIKIGNKDASEPLVLGMKLILWLVKLWSWGNAVGGMVGVPLSSFSVETPDSALLSQKNKTD